MRDPTPAFWDRKASRRAFWKLWDTTGGMMLTCAQGNVAAGDRHREVSAGGAMKSVIRCALLLMALVVWTEPALGRSYLHCPTKKVVIVDTPKGRTSSSIEESLSFWIDEAAKTLVLADGTPLTVRRFDDRWISAARGDMSYEFDRQNGNLTYASSTMKEGSATIIIGSGRCKIAVGPADRSQNPPAPSNAAPG
jgi:hypothetical protein